jgi:hypothetical protein
MLKFEEDEISAFTIYPEGSMPGYLTSGRSSFLCMVPLDKPQSTSIHRTKWKTSYSVDDNKKMLVNN